MVSPQDPAFDAQPPGENPLAVRVVALEQTIAVLTSQLERTPTVRDDLLRGGRHLEGPLTPLPAQGAVITHTENFNDNTEAHYSLVDVTQPILVRCVAMEVSSGPAAQGTMAFALFSNDGQRQIFNGVTATITGSGAQHTLLDVPTFVRPGLYGWVALPQGALRATMRVWHVETGIAAIAAAAGENELSGTFAVVASTMPAFFDPDADVTFEDHGAPQVRFN